MRQIPRSVARIPPLRNLELEASPGQAMNPLREYLQAGIISGIQAPSSDYRRTRLLRAANSRCGFL